MADEIRISLLGHKDHGKSTLIGRLLHDTCSMPKERIAEAKALCQRMGKRFEYAFLLDSFVEERAEGFTLDTTLAQVRHQGLILNMIDVPGHKELVSNMLSGASMADAGFLIVSADPQEGLQAETRLHIFLARLLGMRRLHVLINKMDKAGYCEEAFQGLKERLIEVLSGFGYESTDLLFIPISALEGDNVMERSDRMPWYAGGSLMEMMSHLAAEGHGSGAEDGPARLIVQDVYEDGALAVGRVEQGTISKGAHLRSFPAGDGADVSDILGRRGELMNAGPGANIGIRFDAPLKLRRGSVLVAQEDRIRPCLGFRAHIYCLPGGRMERSRSFRLSCGPQAAQASISSIDWLMHPIDDPRPRAAQGATAILGGESAKASIDLDGPLVLDRFEDAPVFGRFTLSDDKGIVAIGVVL